MKRAAPTPELQVPNVQEAQTYYRDRLGFEIAWYDEAGQIGAVNYGACAIFFRQTQGEVSRGTFWIFADDVDGSFEELRRLGANITEPIRDTPWGMRQFTVEDAWGHKFYFHHDI